MESFLNANLGALEVFEIDKLSDRFLNTFEMETRGSLKINAN